jgi:fatty-acid desaturase
MIKFIDKYIFFLAGFTTPLLIVLKLGGVLSLTWWGVFTPLLIGVAWCVISAIAVGIAGGMDAVKEQKQRSKK